MVLLFSNGIFKDFLTVVKYFERVSMRSPMIIGFIKYPSNSASVFFCSSLGVTAAAVRAVWLRIFEIPVKGVRNEGCIVVSGGFGGCFGLFWG